MFWQLKVPSPVGLIVIIAYVRGAVAMKLPETGGRRCGKIRYEIGEFARTGVAEVLFTAAIKWIHRRQIIHDCAKPGVGFRL
jgi:hypothetical protein